MTCHLLTLLWSGGGSGRGDLWRGISAETVQQQQARLQVCKYWSLVWTQVFTCREDGSWRSSIGAEFPVCAEKGCLYDDLVIQPPENGNVEVEIWCIMCSSNVLHVQVTGRRITYPDNDLSDVATGVYRPGSVLKYTCHPGMALHSWPCDHLTISPSSPRSRGCPRGLRHPRMPQGPLGWSGRRLRQEDSEVPAPGQLPPSTPHQQWILLVRSGLYFWSNKAY